MSQLPAENWLQKDRVTNSLGKNVVRAFVCLFMCVYVCGCVCSLREGLTGSLNENENCSIIHKAVCRTLLPKNMFYERPRKWWRWIFPRCNIFYRFDKLRTGVDIAFGFHAPLLNVFPQF